MSQPILSQQEIDALLAALIPEGKSGAAPLATSRPVKPYNFRHPEKFSRDQIRAIELLHDSFVRHLETVLAAHLRAITTVTLLSLEQISLEEYLRQAGTPTVLYPLQLEPLPGRALLEIQPGLALIMVDRLLGGPGRILTKARELTDVEITLLEGLVWQMVIGLRETWASLVQITPRLEPVSFNPQFLQLGMLLTETCLLLTLEVRLGDTTGLLRLCLPFILLEPVLPRLAPQVWLGTRRTPPPEKLEAVRQHLHRVPVTLSVRLGTAELTVRDLLHLQKGDVIPLDRSTRQELEVLVMGRPKFRAHPGVVGNRLAVRIVAVVEEENHGPPTP